MRRWVVGLLAAVTMLAAMPAAVADDDTPRTYLALGDSVAAGTQQPTPFTDDGYTNHLFRHLRDEYDFDMFVNLACPGDDTAEMISGEGSLCYGGGPLPLGGTSQLDAAVTYLEDHPGEVGLITIVIGANDVLACDLTADDAATCIAGALGQIATNLPQILGALRTAAPGVPIVAMNYYNPNLAFWITGPEGQDLALASLELTPIFNGTLQSLYTAFGVPVADVAGAFKTFKLMGGDPPANVRAVCRYTLMCEKDGKSYVLSDYDPSTPGPQTDIHPSDKGYKKIASTHAELIDELDLLDD